MVWRDLSFCLMVSAAGLSFCAALANAVGNVEAHPEPVDGRAHSSAAPETAHPGATFDAGFAAAPWYGCALTASASSTEQKRRGCPVQSKAIFLTSQRWPVQSGDARRN